MSAQLFSTNKFRFKVFSISLPLILSQLKVFWVFRLSGLSNRAGSWFKKDRSIKRNENCRGDFFQILTFQVLFFYSFFSFLANRLMLLSRVMIQKSLIFANKHSISNRLEITQPRTSKYRLCWVGLGWVRIYLYYKLYTKYLY